MKINDREIRFFPPVKRYVNAIERRLRLPGKIRAQVMSDISTGMTARKEAGESYDDIMKSMGTPKQVAKEINLEMSAFAYRKSPWRFAFLALAVLCGLLLLHDLIWSVLFGFTLSSVGAIGGADGPTAIFVTSVPANDWLSLTLKALLLAAGIAGFIFMRRLPPKDSDPS